MTLATLIIGESGPQCQSSGLSLENLALATFPTTLPITRGKYELIDNQGEFQERVAFSISASCIPDSPTPELAG